MLHISKAKHNDYQTFCTLCNSRTNNPTICVVMRQDGRHKSKLVGHVPAGPAVAMPLRCILHGGPLFLFDLVAAGMEFFLAWTGVLPSFIQKRLSVLISD